MPLERLAGIGVRTIVCGLLLVPALGAQTAHTSDGAIVGRILDETGSPLRAAAVEALVIRNDRGTDMLVTAASAQTDVRGEFKVSGLAPGLYYVSASDPAKAALHYSPTYAPGTVFADEARAITVSGTGEAPRVDVRLKPAPPARVSGQLVAYDSRPLLNGAVTMSPPQAEGAPIAPPQDITILPDGRFTFSGVAPGHYQIRARGQTSSGGSALFAVFATVVDGADIQGIRMILGPGTRMSGTLVVESTRHTTAPPFSTLTVRAPFTDGNTFGDVPTGVVEPDGSFAIRGIMTGEHQVIVQGLQPPWVVRQIAQHGIDLTDLPIDIVDRQQFRDVRIVVTDASSEVTGTVRDAEGEAAPKTGVLLFSVAPSFWMRTSRRVRVAFTGADGRFQIVGLPAGEYFAVASAMIDESILGRRSVLQAFASVATRLKLDADDGKASVDLHVIAAPPSANERRE